MSQEVAARVRAAIADHGPIGFDEYMGLALYGAGGFFERPPIGAERHFVTAPHVHPFVFAHCVRDALLQAWLGLGEPDPLRVIELGAGDGTLAVALREAFAELPVPRLDYLGVEIGVGGREALGAKGFAVAERLDAVGPFEGVVVANEVLDNLPFARARGGASGPVEVRVGADTDGRLLEVEVPWARAEADPPVLLPGQESTVPLGALTMLRGIALTLTRGYVLLIDYGSPTADHGEVHGYREHRQVGDVLADPGSSDITAGVDAGLVVERAGELGLQAFGPIAQTEALAGLGLDRWDATMRELQADLQRDGRAAEAVRIWETRSRASLLAEPSGLGSFWWLVLATDGLPPPTWVAPAGDSAGPVPPR
jgi:SAM-dependent MidA family methyltransferase